MPSIGLLVNNEPLKAPLFPTGAYKCLRRDPSARAARRVSKAKARKMGGRSLDECLRHVPWRGVHKREVELPTTIDLEGGNESGTNAVESEIRNPEKSYEAKAEAEYTG